MNATAAIPRSRPPAATLVLVASVAAVACVPGASAALAWDRASVASGGAWRWVTGHWVHFGAMHAAADGAGLLVAGALLESASRRAWAWALAATLAATGAALWLGGVAGYGGMSAVVHAFAAALACAWWRAGGRARRGAALALGAGLAWRLARGGDAGVLPDGIAPCGVAHAAGTACGLVAGWLPGARDAMVAPCSRSSRTAAR